MERKRPKAAAKEPRMRRGVSYVELLVAVLLLAVAAAGALAHWSLVVRTPAEKRSTEMGVYVGVQELEKLKARRFLSLPITSANSPLISYYDRNGASQSGPVARGYKVKTWITSVVDRDADANTEDLRAVKMEVWDTYETESAPYERIETLLSFGGI